MFQNIKVIDFKKALLDKLNGYDDCEITSIGKVQGKADGLINPYVVLLKNTARNNEEKFLPSFQDDVSKLEPPTKEESNKQSALVGGTYAIQLQLKKPVDDGTFFRFVVVNQANEEKAKFWFTKSISGDIYTVTACFTDERYSWIQLYVEVDVEVDETEGTNRYYPTEAYMSTYSLKMTTDQCRDIIRYFTEASEVCDVITKFFKKEAIK